jgi:hypothetical protein
MSEAYPSAVDLRDLKEEVGSLFFLWSFVESTLAEARKEQCGVADGSIRATLDAWAAHEAALSQRPVHIALVKFVQSELSEAIAIRNGFAHALVGWKARLHADHPEARYVIRTNGTIRELTHSELKAWNGYIGRLATGLDRLTGAGRHRDPEATDIYPDVRRLLAEAAPPGRPPLP